MACSEAWCNGEDINMFWVNVQFYGPIVIISLVLFLLILVILKRW